jgi:hypothetical protein
VIPPPVTGSFPADLPTATGSREASALGCAAANRRSSSSRLTTQLPSPWLPNCVLSLPKNDRERIIPLSDWDIEVIQRHLDRFPPRPTRSVGEEACG